MSRYDSQASYSTYEFLPHKELLQIRDILVCFRVYVCVCVCVYCVSVWTYACIHSGSGMFALSRYIYVQAFGYCRFLEKLENTLHSWEPVAVSLKFYVLNARIYVRIASSFERGRAFYGAAFYSVFAARCLSRFAGVRSREGSCFPQSLFRDVRVRFKRDGQP